jgi:hypothetical protein
VWRVTMEDMSAVVEHANKDKIRRNQSWLVYHSQTSKYSADDADLRYALLAGDPSLRATELI